jgi:hypothetical protein
VPVSSFVIEYTRNTTTRALVPANITDADKAQICANLILISGAAVGEAHAYKRSTGRHRRKCNQSTAHCMISPCPRAAGLACSVGQVTCQVIVVLPAGPDSVLVVAELRATAPEFSAPIQQAYQALQNPTPAVQGQLLAGLPENLVVAVVSSAIGTSAVETGTISQVTPPSEPLDVAASFPSTTTCDLNAIVSWSPPASNGGATVGLYVVACTTTSNGIAATVSAPKTSTPLLLEANKDYTCYVVAINVAGTSVQSIASNVIARCVCLFPFACIPSQEL